MDISDRQISLEEWNSVIDDHMTSADPILNHL
jgi:hypothetical protein